MNGGSPSGQSGSMAAGLAPGSVFAGYRLESRIGAGGMAVVFRARDEALGRTVALKVIAPALADDPQFRERFIREARAVVAVDHPHIVPVYAAGEADGVLYLAMRFVSGGDLRTVIDREGRLTGERTTALLSPIASALDSAHAAGLIHRDVKPANILVDVRPGRPEYPYLSDFGLVKGAMSVGLTKTGEFLGTANYVAPEQISGQPARPQTDQYALACVAYTLLTGILPYAHDNSMAIMWAHMHAEPPSLVARLPDQPSAADRVFARAMAKSPEDRYGTCEEFIAALRTAFGASPQAVPVAGNGPLPVAGPPEPAPPEGIDLYRPAAPQPAPEPYAGSMTMTSAVPRFGESGPTATAGAVGSYPYVEPSTAGRPPQSAPPQPPLAQPTLAQGRPRGRRRGLIVTATAAIAVVVAVAALLVAHPWAQPPVLKPTGLTVVSGTAQSVKIGWSRPASGPLPANYEIFRNGTEVGTVLGSQTSYTEGGLTPNTTYGFQVVAVRGGKQSPISATLTDQTPPLQPTGLAVKRAATSSVEIAWSGPSSGPPPGSYEILRNGVEIATVSGSTTSYTDNGLAPGKAYSYQVIAVTGSKKSVASATLTNVRTTTPPLSAAVLDWTGQVTEHMVSVNPSETGWRLHPGDTVQDSWSFSPNCSSGPCAATLNGAYDGFTFTTTLNPSGATYSGSVVLKNYFYCNGVKSDTYSATLTINITISAASTQSNVWTATSFSGNESIYAPAAYTCYAATGQLTVKS